MKKKEIHQPETITMDQSGKSKGMSNNTMPSASCNAQGVVRGPVDPISDSNSQNPTPLAMNKTTKERRTLRNLFWLSLCALSIGCSVFFCGSFVMLCLANRSAIHCGEVLIVCTMTVVIAPIITDDVQSIAYLLRNKREGITGKIA